jgi:5'-nucleotidase
MRFLLTNDDGIYARGLAALHQELCQVAECLVVAPEVEQSAVGHAITIFRPLMVREARKNGALLGYAVAGTPADCVKIGLSELAAGPVDLVVSGINRGANVGINVLYSGTVSAATEAAILGVPSLAVSLDSHREADFGVAARFARQMTDFILKNPLPQVALNVNVPALPESEIRGVAVVRQGRARLMENFDRRVDPRENVYYWLAGETRMPSSEDADTDAGALKKGMITVTPICFDLTRHDLLAVLKARVSGRFGTVGPPMLHNPTQSASR